MVWHLRKPTHAALLRDLARLRGVLVTYPTPGISRGPCPTDYRTNHLCARIGRGREVFERAREGLQTWAMFTDLQWIDLCRPTPVVAVEQVVATLARVGGVWAVNPCKIVYCQGFGDGDRASNTAEFGYGTLPGHVFLGEERFTVRFDPATGGVDYELCAYTRPASILTRFGQLYATRVQRRFARESARSLARFATRARSISC